MSNEEVIGIFDSGVGGLSVLQQIRRLLPRENLIYVADSGHAPWGCKDEEFIEQRSRAITEYLLQQGAKLIVIACNTATASIIEKFRHQYGIPFIGVEPGIKAAIKISKTGNIGIMATAGTLSSKRYNELSQRFSARVNLYHKACPGLAEQVECCQINTAETTALLEEFLQPLLQQQVDSIVLGCTHYSFLSPLIRKIVGDSINMVDTSYAVAEQMVRILKQERLQNTTESEGSVSYVTSGGINNTRSIIARLLDQEIESLELLS